MAEFHKERFEAQLERLASEFISTNSNRTSLITVTGIETTDKFGSAVVLVSVFPDEKADEALFFLTRQGTDFRAFLKTKSNLSRIPSISFKLDRGEKNRQALDRIQ